MYALDLTPVFDQLLKSKEGAPTRKPRFDATQTEGFLKEAYRIVSTCCARQNFQIHFR